MAGTVCNLVVMAVLNNLARLSLVESMEYQQPIDYLKLLMHQVSSINIGRYGDDDIASAINTKKSLFLLNVTTSMLPAPT
jgi:hypothetical protein